MFPDWEPLKHTQNDHSHWLNWGSVLKTTRLLLLNCSRYSDRLKLKHLLFVPGVVPFRLDARWVEVQEVIIVYVFGSLQANVAVMKLVQ